MTSDYGRSIVGDMDVEPPSGLRLIQALVGSEYLDLWHNDAEFHATIVVLATTVLPDLLAGTALRCRQGQSRRNELLARMEQQLAPLFSADVVQP